MSDNALKTLSEIATEAHTRIQESSDINPVVGVRRGMRDSGIPADAMTIDCLRTGKRILLILHDKQPGMLLYQFTEINDEAGSGLQQMPFDQLRAETLAEWIQKHFS